MKYEKLALSFEQQADRLISRGLIVADKAALIQQLRSVNYYRLSAYWYPFKRVDPETKEEKFAPNISFDMIWRRYTFDRQLRLLAIEALSG